MAAAAPAPDASEAAAVRAFERLPQLAERDPWLVQRGRFLTTECLIQVGSVPFHLSIAAGRVAGLVRGPRLLSPWSFAVRASAQAWLNHWRPVPAPGWHDLFAMTRHQEASVEGYLFPLMANLQYVKDLLALPRKAEG